MAILYFCIYFGPTILHKKLQDILSKIEGMTAIFVILDFLSFFGNGSPLGAKGPQLGPQGLRGPKGPPALSRSYKEGRVAP